LLEARAKQIPTCLRTQVVDAPTLHSSIELGRRHDFLVIAFRDPTNIPLELVIASLQSTNTILLKEITDPNDAEDAITTLGVMEVGADGVMFSPSAHPPLDAFLRGLAHLEGASLPLQTARIVRTEPVGMGHRSCLDLATIFEPTEGLVVGSTSQGGFLCCPEVFFLPYMELRPFRVNAGAVHSYVYNRNNRTDYMTELRVGSPVMVLNGTGRGRRATVGRTKTEVRPLRLIEAEFSSGERINVVMQDDWHVRIFSDQMQPRNITELKPEDPVLAHLAKPGRHVGIGVDEYILES
jgi:3-dehydroquinate synthase II/3-amino-4-hydroxybenzoic acid synthase